MKTSFSAVFLVILVSGCVLVQSYSQPGLYQRRQVNNKRTPENTSKTPLTSVKAPTTSAVPTKPPVTSAAPTKPPVTSAVPTKPPVTSAAPTKPPVTSAVPTKPPVTSAAPTTPTPATTTPKPTPPHCTPGQKKPVTNTCRDYTECDKTYNWVKKSCSTWCHNFNPDLSKCVWSWQYHCVDPTNPPCTSVAPSSTASPTTAAPTTAAPTTAAPTTAAPTTAAPTSAKSSTTSTSVPSTISTSGTTKGTTSAPECTKNGEMKVYKKGDCKDYLLCQSGKWVMKSCSWGYDFDVNKLECRWSWWATC